VIALDLAQNLRESALTGEPMLQPADALTVEQAYQVQEQLVGLQIAAGDSLIGLKLGFTSRAKMIQMGIDEMIAGRLTASAAIQDGGTVDTNGMIHPRVEPELAFRISAVSGTRLTVDAVAPALELIDSRYRDFKFSLPAVIADNTSACRHMVGRFQPLPSDLSNLGMIMSINGQPVAVGSSAAILGNPWRSVAAAERLARQASITLMPGHIILAGAATAAVPLPRTAYVSVEIEGLGLAGFYATGRAA
jgi:2-oxo-3-hexenedioate decarboxylase